MNEQHYRNLESMYLAAPINDIFKPTITIEESAAVIEIELNEQYHHAAGGVHGSVYFKMLDDAAFFAANSLEGRFFVLTASFTTDFLKPVSVGKMRSVGRVTSYKKHKIFAEAVVYDADNNEIGRGNGLFVRSRMPLQDAAGYNVLS